MNQGGQQGLGSSSSTSSNKGGLSGEQDRIARDDNGNQAVSYSAGGATIQADPATNSLIISAPEPLYRSLREVIDQLDQRRAQVLVESLIVEVSEAKAAEFGIQWMTGAGNINSGGTSFIGGTNLGGSGLSGKGPTSIDALGGGMTLGVVKGTVDVLGNKVINLGVLARAMQKHRRGQHPVHAEPADAGQPVRQHPGRQDRALRDRPVRHQRQQRQQQPVPDHRARGRGPEAEHPPADLRRRHGQAGHLPGSQQHRRKSFVDHQRHRHQQARHRHQRAGRRRPDHRAGRPAGRQRHAQLQRRSGPERHSGAGQSVPLRQPQAHQDQPDGVPAPLRDARRQPRRRRHHGSLRLHAPRPGRRAAGRSLAAAQPAGAHADGAGLGAVGVGQCLRHAAGEPGRDHASPAARDGGVLRRAPVSGRAPDQRSGPAVPRQHAAGRERGARPRLAVWRGRQIQRHAAIRLGGLAVRRRAHRPARAQRPAGLCAGRSRRHGLRGAQSGRQDPGTVSTATRLLRELGYKSEVVSHL